MEEFREELKELRGYASDGEFDARYVEDHVDKVRFAPCRTAPPARLLVCPVCALLAALVRPSHHTRATPPPPPPPPPRSPWTR